MSKYDIPNDEVIDQLKSGEMSRRDFSKVLAAAGICAVTTSTMPGRAQAAASDQPTYFTWGGWNDPYYHPTFVADNGEPPNFASYASSEEGFTKMRAGFVVDVAHPCNVEIPRWIASGLFQPLDTSLLSNWDDLIPNLWQLEGNVVDGKPYFAPMDWGQTSITYRTDLVDWEGEEHSWGLLWDERYKGKIGSLGSAGDVWWCAAIFAGVDFKDIAKPENLEKVANLLRQQRPLIRMYSDDVTSLQQALASGELVAAMTWNDTPLALRTDGVPVDFAKPKEGALTWVCGLMMHAKAPKPDKAHELIDSLLSVERGVMMITEEGYGHSNSKAMAAVDDKQLADLGLIRDAAKLLNDGQFMIPQEFEFDTKSNEMFEMIKAGF
ncbi:MAG: extracellular solute-binding protein [Pseudomonadota bacterium]